VILDRTPGDGERAERFVGGLTIAPHVHVCVTVDGSVMLDLKRDKYLGFGKEATELLANAIAVWPSPRWSYSMGRLGSTEAVAETEELLGLMAAEGLLVSDTDHCTGRAFTPADTMKRDWISIGDELEVAPTVTRAHVANFVVAFLWARGSLAWRSLWEIAETHRVEKARHGCNLDPAHMQEVADLVGAFRRMRPFVFAADGRCLLHALTLIQFLRGYGFYPEWVIGVATRHWAAHSWVQWGDYLLDTNPDKVCRFTPILVV
jgi:hypothetical protein